MASIEQITQELTWPIRQKELNPESSISAVKLADDDLGMHLGLFHNNKLITVVSLFQKDNILQFRKFATDSQYQNMGFGKQMMEYILHYAQQQNITKIWCNARCTATSFYQKFGFVLTPKLFTKNNISYIVMVKEI